MKSSTRADLKAFLTTVAGFLMLALVMFGIGAAIGSIVIGYRLVAGLVS